MNPLFSHRDGIGGASTVILRERVMGLVIKQKLITRWRNTEFRPSQHNLGLSLLVFVVIHSECRWGDMGPAEILTRPWEWQLHNPLTTMAPWVLLWHVNQRWSRTPKAPFLQRQKALILLERMAPASASSMNKTNLLYANVRWRFEEWWLETAYFGLAWTSCTLL